MSNSQPDPADKLAAQWEAEKALRESILARAVKDNAGKSQLIEEAREAIEKTRTLIDEIQKERGV